MLMFPEPSQTPSPRHSPALSNEIASSQGMGQLKAEIIAERAGTSRRSFFLKHRRSLTRLQRNVTHLSRSEKLDLLGMCGSGLSLWGLRRQSLEKSACNHRGLACSRMPGPS
jgi:hypothetical protein